MLSLLVQGWSLHKYADLIICSEPNNSRMVQDEFSVTLPSSNSFFILIALCSSCAVTISSSNIPKQIVAFVNYVSIKENTVVLVEVFLKQENITALPCLG